MSAPDSLRTALTASEALLEALYNLRALNYREVPDLISHGKSIMDRLEFRDKQEFFLRRIERGLATDLATSDPEPSTTEGQE